MFCSFVDASAQYNIWGAIGLDKASDWWRRNPIKNPTNPIKGKQKSHRVRLSIFIEISKPAQIQTQIQMQIRTQLLVNEIQKKLPPYPPLRIHRGMEQGGKFPESPFRRKSNKNWKNRNLMTKNKSLSLKMCRWIKCKSSVALPCCAEQPGTLALWENIHIMQILY